MRSLPLLSMPEVCELPWLVVDELQVRRGLCGAWPGALKLSVSIPEVCELPWLVVEWRDRRLWWDMLPALLPLARERLSRCSMSSSRASLMYDSLYCFFSVSAKHRHILTLTTLLDIIQNVFYAQKLAEIVSKIINLKAKVQHLGKLFVFWKTVRHLSEIEYDATTRSLLA